MATPTLAERCLILLLAVFTQPLPAAEPLIIVEDDGGTSALPYYDALDLQTRVSGAPTLAPVIPRPPLTAVSDAAMLPVRSPKLTPGAVIRRELEAPGLQPFFLVGDDAISRTWLRQHALSLRERNAVGLVVNVETAEGLEQLRQLAPNLPLSPAPADDLADRLELRHYPVLITATGIEQ